MEMRLSMLASSDGVTIEIRDQLSRIKFVKLNLTPEEFCRCLSREVEVECSGFVVGLDKVGKKLEIEVLCFEMPEASSRDKVLAAQLAAEKCPEGWTPDLYFGSKGSFYTDNHKTFARCNIRRWMEGENND